jgi:hypothetical protein
VEVEERVWRSSSRSHVRPFASGIGVTHRSVSRRLGRVLSDFGIEHSFARAALRVHEHYGFEINPSAVRKATLKSAQCAAGLLEKEYARDFRALPPEGANQLIAEVDGSMICTVEPGKRSGKRPRKWKEMRLSAAQAHRSTRAFYAASFGAVDQIGRQLGHCAKEAGRGLKSDIHCLGDGAEWIRLQSREIFGDRGRFLCDYFHVTEYLAAAAPTCRPGAGGQWRRAQQKRLKNRAAHKVIKELEAHLEEDSVAEEQAPVRAAHRYLSNRIENLDYAGALEKELPIGSGLIESGHRHVLQARLKLPGCAWLPDNAEKLAQLRVLRTNNRWEEIWKN